MKDLLKEGREIYETFKRKLNEDEDGVVIPTAQAKQAAKFFVKVWQNWFIDDGVNINGNYESGMTSDIVSELTSTGTLILNFHNAITDVLVDDEQNVNACAEQIQYIVNEGSTGSGDFGGNVKVSQYLNSMTKFANEMDKLIKQADDREGKKILMDYKISVQKFATLLRSVPKN